MEWLPWFKHGNDPRLSQVAGMMKLLPAYLEILAHLRILGPGTPLLFSMNITTVITAMQMYASKVQRLEHVLDSSLARRIGLRNFCHAEAKAKEYSQRILAPRCYELRWEGGAYLIWKQRCYTRVGSISLSHGVHNLVKFCRKQGKSYASIYRCFPFASTAIKETVLMRLF